MSTQDQLLLNGKWLYASIEWWGLAEGLHYVLCQVCSFQSCVLYVICSSITKIYFKFLKTNNQKKFSDKIPLWDFGNLRSRQLAVPHLRHPSPQPLPLFQTTLEPRPLSLGLPEKCPCSHDWEIKFSLKLTINKWGKLFPTISSPNFKEKGLIWNGLMRFISTQFWFHKENQKKSCCNWLQEH